MLLLAWFHDLGSESKRNVLKALERDTRLLGNLSEKKGGKASWPAQLAVFPLQTCSKLLVVVQRSTAPVIIGLCLACARVQYSNWTFRTRSTHNRRDITISSSLGRLLSSSTISHMPTKQFTAGSSLLDSTATKGPRHLSYESRENRFLTRLANLEVHARTTTILREDNQRIVLYLGKLPSSLGKIQERLLGAKFDSDDTRSTSE